MVHLGLGFLRRLVRFFVAGVLALLPVVVTVAVVVWVIEYLQYLCGPETLVGKQLTAIGLQVGKDSAAPYFVGWFVVIVVVFAVGLVVELGAKKWLGRTVESLFKRIPLVGSIYSTSRQMIDMIGPGENDAMKGMTPVFCSFGKDPPSSVLALLVSPLRYHVLDREHLIVIIPTAPVPFGGAMMFVPVENVRPAGMSIDGLMSMYLSMGATAGQFVPPVPAANAEPDSSTP
jgi:uncharacterized membrane protein